MWIINSTWLIQSVVARGRFKNSPRQIVYNENGCSSESITASNDPLNLNRHTVVDKDDIYRYSDEEATAFRFTDERNECACSLRFHCIR